MKISTILQYKVVEADKALAIINAADSLQRAGTVELIMSDMATCCEYLARYTHERARGAHPRDAHSYALKGAKVITPGDLDKPEKTG